MADIVIGDFDDLNRKIANDKKQAQAASKKMDELQVVNQEIAMKSRRAMAEERRREQNAIGSALGRSQQRWADRHPGLDVDERISGRRRPRKPYQQPDYDTGTDYDPQPYAPQKGKDGAGVEKPGVGAQEIITGLKKAAGAVAVFVTAVNAATSMISGTSGIASKMGGFLGPAEHQAALLAKHTGADQQTMYAKILANPNQQGAQQLVAKMLQARVMENRLDITPDRIEKGLDALASGEMEPQVSGLILGGRMSEFNRKMGRGQPISQEQAWQQGEAIATAQTAHDAKAAQGDSYWNRRSQVGHRTRMEYMNPVSSSIPWVGGTANTIDAWVGAEGNQGSPYGFTPTGAPNLQTSPVRQPGIDLTQSGRGQGSTERAAQMLMQAAEKMNNAFSNRPAVVPGD